MLLAYRDENPFSMVQQNWGEQASAAIFKNWLATAGKGTRLAVLDTGADLTHPALAHLNQPGHKLNAALPNFQPDNPALHADGNVTDAYRVKGHGTQCLSITSARAEGSNAVLGLAPDAEVFIVKINSVDNRFFRAKDFLRGLEAAARLGVDLVVASVNWPVADLALEGINDPEVERVFQLLRESGAALLASLPNMGDNDSWAGLAASRFPCNRPEAINVGAISAAAFRNNQAQFHAEPDVHFLASNVMANYARVGGTYEEAPVSSSFATYIVAGVAAIYLASIKKRLKEQYQPLTKALLVKGIGQRFAKMDSATWQAGSLQLFKTAAAVNPT